MAYIKQRIDPITGEKESVESMIKRFKKQVMKDGTLQDLKKYEYGMSKRARRRLKDKEAMKRLKRKMNKNK